MQTLTDQNLSQLTDDFDKTIALQSDSEPEFEFEDDDDDDDDEIDCNNGDEFEFFIGGENPNSPVSAEEIFQNGKILPSFKFSGENSGEATTSYGPPVRKLFVVSPEKDDVAEGPYCEWSKKESPANIPVPEMMSQKSNSTGFSKLWRVRDLLVRSHSDGKDAFVFLKNADHEKNAPKTSSFREKMKLKKKIVDLDKIKVKVERETETTAFNEKKKGKGKEKKKKSAYEVLYGKRTEKKAGKSYLPYRQDLVGFFTNSNGGMSRNVHPY